ncbi:MAG: lanthionine synthetase LanC family protein, partial [Planctomycetota bacterium]
MKTLSGAVAVLATLAVCTPSLAVDYLGVATEVGDSLVHTARKEGKARWWSQYAGGPETLTEEKRNYPVSLYSGITGTGYFLLNLYRVTGNRKFLSAASGAGWRLVEIAKPTAGGGVKWEGTTDRKGRPIPDGTRYGLYDGNAGIGLFLMHLFRETKEKAFEKAALAAYQRILGEATEEKGGLHWTYSFTDIIGGESGIGLCLAEMGRLTEDKRYGEAALKTGTWLLATADREGGTFRWAKYGSFDPNFSHGTSGIAFFLASMDGGEFSGPARSAARWVEKQGTPCEGEGTLWRYYAEPPPKGKRNWVMNSWCHGAPGTIRLFILLHRVSGEKKWLDAALKGGGGIRHSLQLSKEKIFYYNPTYCCGAAGCIE